MCDQMSKSVRKDHIKSEIKVLDEEILTIGHQLEDKMEKLRKKMSRKLKRRGLRL
jgi:hypothetical protein